jgi:chromate transport protein ChrA
MVLPGPFLGWVSSRDFLLGFAILNAMPGPNFNYAVFLGVLSVPSKPALGAFLGYLGIFLPGILLKLALLPIYKKWRSYAVVKSILRGLNAAAAGLVYAAVYALFLGASMIDVWIVRSSPLIFSSWLYLYASQRQLFYALTSREFDCRSLVGRRRGLCIRRKP